MRSPADTRYPSDSASPSVWQQNLWQWIYDALGLSCLLIDKPMHSSSMFSAGNYWWCQGKNCREDPVRSLLIVPVPLAKSFDRCNPSNMLSATLQRLNKGQFYCFRNQQKHSWEQKMLLVFPISCISTWCARRRCWFQSRLLSAAHSLCAVSAVAVPGAFVALVRY